MADKSIPGPFKCPDCGVWWVGYEHRCAPAQKWATNVPGISVQCTCQFDRNGYRTDDSFCPVHDCQWTYTADGHANGTD